MDKEVRIIIEKNCCSWYYVNIYEIHERRILKIITQGKEVNPKRAFERALDIQFIELMFGNMLKAEPIMENANSDEISTEAYSITVCFTPHTWDNMKFPYFWRIMLSEETLETGWSRTPTCAFRDAMKEFKKEKGELISC